MTKNSSIKTGGAMMGKQAGERIYRLSYLRVAACLAIVTLHTVYGANVYFQDTLSASQNLISRMVENCMMWAVPSFLMVTGALLLDPKKEIPLKKIFGKYIARMLAALLIFTMVFRVFDMVMDKEPVDAASVLQGFTEFFTDMSWGHLWYLYLLIGLYLLLPFYKKIAAHSTSGELKYLLAVYAVFLSLLPLLGMWGIECGFYICVSLIYPLYLFCGHMLHAGKLRVGKAAAWCLVIITTSLIVYLTKVRWDTGFEAMDQLWGYSSILVVLQTAGVFALLETLPEGRLPRLNVVMGKLDACSFGTYLIHMIFVRLILRYGNFNPYENGGVAAFIALIGGIFIVSFAITWILRKIPGVGKVL
ncbi:acyltransferase [Clostridiales bacterium]|nr:acyltransferase [Clostridiales bacterium]